MDCVPVEILRAQFLPLLKRASIALQKIPLNHLELAKGFEPPTL